MNIKTWQCPYITWLQLPSWPLMSPEGHLPIPGAQETQRPSFLANMMALDASHPRKSAMENSIIFQMLLYVSSTASWKHGITPVSRSCFVVVVSLSLSLRTQVLGSGAVNSSQSWLVHICFFTGALLAKELDSSTHLVFTGSTHRTIMTIIASDSCVYNTAKVSLGPYL